MNQHWPRVVILGGGFGGLTLAQKLRNAPVRLTLIDRQNHHLFQPLLYQVATAGLSANDIASPIRRVLRGQKNVEVVLADATAIDLDTKTVVLTDGAVGFDYLVVATGVTHSYFGHDEWAPYAPGLKSITDALEIRRRVLLAFEVAEREPDPEKRHAWLTFVIVGAGPTGVELAGAITEVARYTLARDFHHIDPTQARIILLEGSPRVLPTYIEELSEKARVQLEELGVDVRTSQMVSHIDADGVTIGDDRIEAKTVLWAAGVAASPLAQTLGVPLDRAGRVRVNPDLTVPGRDDVFVIGDLASLEQDGKPVPGVAPAAMQQAKHTAKNLLRAVQGQPLLPFRYRDKGSLATIGRAAAVADLGRVKLSGVIAWLAWLFIHLFFLIGFRNRFIVLFEWAWSYVTYDRGDRLMTDSARPDDHLVAEREATVPGRS